MPVWPRLALGRIRDLAARRRVRLTYKAFRELTALNLGLDESDACAILACLIQRELVGRQISELTGEWK